MGLGDLRGSVVISTITFAIDFKSASKFAVTPVTPAMTSSWHLPKLHPKSTVPLA